MSFLSLQPPYFVYVIPQMVMPVMHVPQMLPKANVEQPQPRSDMPLDETTKQLQQFHLRLGSKARQPIDQDRIEVGRRGNERLFSGFPCFEDIYAFTIERYKQNYKPEQKKTSWGIHDLQLFLWVLDKWCLMFGKLPSDFDNQDWNQISLMIPFRTGQACMFKWLSLRKHKLQEFPWLTEEQLYLFQLAEETEGRDWVDVSRRLFKKFDRVYRSPKQCRQHWALYLNSLHDRAKKLWGLEEDVKLITSFGNKGRHWKQISKELVGRSQNAIKNRFSLLLRKFGSGLDHLRDQEKAPPILERIQAEAKQEAILNGEEYEPLVVAGTQSPQEPPASTAIP